MCFYKCAAALHGDSIPSLKPSAGLSLTVTTHYLPVSDTAEQRVSSEEMEGLLVMSDRLFTNWHWVTAPGLYPCCLHGESDPQLLQKHNESCCSSKLHSSLSMMPLTHAEIYIQITQGCENTYIRLDFHSYRDLPCLTCAGIDGCSDFSS